MKLSMIPQGLSHKGTNCHLNSMGLPVDNILSSHGKELISLTRYSFIDKGHSGKRVKGKLEYWKSLQRTYFYLQIRLGCWYGKLYNMGLADGLGKYLSLGPLGMKLKKMSGTIIFLFCNLLFVIVFRLIVGFLLDQWPMTTG